MTWSFLGWKGGAATISAGPAGETLAADRSPRGARPVAGLDRGGGGPDQPGVHRQAVTAGGLLDAGLELVGQAEVDPRHRAVVGDLGELGRLGRGGLGAGLLDRRRG